MRYILLLLASVMILSGCSNPHRLGSYVAKVRQEQVYNPNATQDNLSVIPDGNGEKMESVYSSYTGKEASSLGDSSQVLTGFTN